MSKDNFNNIVSADETVNRENKLANEIKSIEKNYYTKQITKDQIRFKKDAPINLKNNKENNVSDVSEINNSVETNINLQPTINIKSLENNTSKIENLEKLMTTFMQQIKEIMFTQIDEVKTVVNSNTKKIDLLYQTLKINNNG